MQGKYCPNLKRLYLVPERGDSHVTLVIAFLGAERTQAYALRPGSEAFEARDITANAIITLYRAHHSGDGVDVLVASPDAWNVWEIDVMRGSLALAIETLDEGEYERALRQHRAEREQEKAAEEAALQAVYADDDIENPF